MKRLFHSFLVVFLAILSSAGLFAQQNVSAPQKFALVIGNSNYSGISKLTNPVNDANDMAVALQGLGFNVDKVLDGDLEQMENAVTNLKRKLIGASRNSYGFFFYAGHGVQASDGQNYLIPLQANNIQNETHLRVRAVSLQFVLDSLREAGNELNMIVLDACRDNPFGWNRSGTRGLSLVSYLPSGSIVMYAAASGQKADDGSGRNGLFTSHLLNNLKTTGLSVYEIFDKTMGDVKKATGGMQDPELSLRFSGANSVYLGQRPTSNVPAQPAQPVQPQQATTQPSSTANTMIITQRGLATQEMQIEGLSAAHSNMVIGSKARVTNVANGKEVEVTITGRISPSATRVIDLSRDAAQALNLNSGDPVIINGKYPNPNSITQRGMATQEMQTDGLSAAHSNRFIGSKARVTNVANGKEVVVTITGRITPSIDRIIDLSPDAAKALDLGSGGQVIVSPSE